MIVLDASGLIVYRHDGDAHHGRALTLLTGKIDGPIGAHSFTLAEVLVAPALTVTGDRVLIRPTSGGSVA